MTVSIEADVHGSTSPATADLCVSNLAVSYGSNRVVSDVSFTLESGKSLALLGPSGCGKTTLLNTIAGFTRPDAGAIRVKGEDVAGIPVQDRGLSMVFQTHALFPHMTVLENVLFGLRARRRGRVKPADRKAAHDAVEMVRLSEFGHRRPHELSGGQRQRVALARALVVRPRVLLLDEPLSSLDAALRSHMRLELRELQRVTGVTMVYVTHDKEEAFALGDYVGVMRSGRLEQVGTPQQVCDNPATTFVASFLVNSNLLGGTIGLTAGGEDICTVDLTAGRSDDVPRRSSRCRNPHRLPSATPATIAIAPWAISLTGPAQPDCSLQAQVKTVQFMGDSIHLVAAVGGQDVLVYLGRKGQAAHVPVPHVGELVGLTWRAEHAIALPRHDIHGSAGGTLNGDLGAHEL